MKVVVIGAGPVGALAALYAAKRGHDVEVYELRGGMWTSFIPCIESFRKMVSYCYLSGITESYQDAKLRMSSNFLSRCVASGKSQQWE